MTNKFSKTEPIYIHKRIINNNAIEMFRQVTRNWLGGIEISRNPNVCYKIFLKNLRLFMMSIFQLK